MPVARPGADMSDEPVRAAMAERAARAGGVVARKQFREPLDIETKANKNDFVTAADRDAQRQVIATIRQEFPSDPIVCEEEATPPGASIELESELPESGPAWVVDPIDGTANFVRGMRFWATSIATVRNGEPVAAATYLPALEDSYTAGPESVTLNDNSMRVSDRTDPETFAISVLAWWPNQRADTYAGLYRAALRRFGDVRQLGCMQGVLALVAAGSLEGVILRETPHPWDAIAGVHLVRRAGGTATDIHGEPWTHDSEGMVVSNGEAHDELLGVFTAADELEVA